MKSSLLTPAPPHVPFNMPAETGSEAAHIEQVLRQGELTEGPYGNRCRQWLQDTLSSAAAHMTPSCTHALEMAALLLNIGPGDEIIMPSYTYVSTANAFVLRGAVPVFVDIRPDTMNMDETLVEAAVTPRTKAIAVMHYGGVACEMEKITLIARRHRLAVIEDAAHAFLARWQGRYLGTLGLLGCFSFHQTKNFTAGEGGALMVNDAGFVARAEYLQHKGTDRQRFLRGEISHYSWVDKGSSYVMSELGAAYLYGNLAQAESILARRHALWNSYYAAFAPLQAESRIALPVVPAGCEHNAHMFYIKVKDREERDDFLDFMKSQGICALFHYIPLHSSVAGRKYGRFHGEDWNTTRESERLVRLPVFYNMTPRQSEHVISSVTRYYAS